MSKKMPEIDRPMHDRADYEDLVQAYREDLSQGLQSSDGKGHSGRPDTLASTLNQGLTALDQTVTALVDNLRDALQLQYQQWEEIRDIVEQERRILSDAYSIDVPPDSLSAMVQLRRERHAQAEQSLVRSKMDFQSDMERRQLELSLKEKAFEERCHHWDVSFAEKCKRWESEIRGRQEALEMGEQTLKRKQDEQESLWISRSEELDAAYRQRGSDLEASYEIKLQNLVAAHEEKYRQIEAQLALYQTRPPIDSMISPPTPPPASFAPVQEVPIDPWSPTASAAPIAGQNRSHTRIVRPIKISSRRGNS